jgi:hypothetical protein
MAEDGFTPAGGLDREAAENFTALFEGDLRRLLAPLRGRVDLIRAGLVDLGVASLPTEELAARALIGGAGEGEAP